MKRMMRTHINTPFMKKHFLFLLLISVGFSIKASGQTTYYWVDGSGDFTDPAHWAATSGGLGGAGIPNLNTHVVFDNGSFTANNQQVNLNGGSIDCNNMDWSNVTLWTPDLTGSASLQIYGDLTFCSNLLVTYTGITYFRASNKIATINTANHSFPNAVVFEGNMGQWNFLSNFNAAGNIMLNRGHVVTNGHEVECYRFYSNPVNLSYSRILDMTGTLLKIDLENDQYDSTIVSCNINNNLNSLTILSSSTSKIFLLGGPMGSNLSTMLSGINLQYPDIEFSQNGKFMGKHNLYNNLLFKANARLYVDTCRFDSVEIYKNGLAYSDSCRFTRFFFSTHPSTCVCGDCRNIDYGLLQGNNNQIDKIIDFNRNGTIDGNNNYADSCRFNANGYLLSGSNEFNKMMMRRIWPYGCSCNVYAKDSLTLEKNKTQTVHDTIILFGNYYCEHTRIRSADNVLQATIATNHPQLLDYVELKGINGSFLLPSAGTDTAKRSIDLGNNLNWYFKNNYIPLTDSSKTVADVSPCSYSTNGTVTIWGKGGEKPYTYWIKTSTGGCTGGYTENTPSTNNTFTGLGKGIHDFKIVDAYGCESVAVSATVGGPDPFVIDSVRIIPVKCNGQIPPDGKVTVFAKGGTPPLKYKLNNGPWVSGNTFTGLSAGSYIISVSDIYTCTPDTVHVTMTEPPALILSVSTPPNTIKCNCDSTGKIIVKVGGGVAPYAVFINPIVSYCLQNSIRDTIHNANLSGTGITYLVRGGDYDITITDGNGCVIEDLSRHISEPPPLVYSYSIQAVSGIPTTYCITVTPSGGVGPYTHHWQTSATTATVCGLSPGEYCDTIRDSKGCTKLACILIVPLSITVTHNDSICYGMNAGWGCVIASGGSPSYGYTWSSISPTPGLPPSVIHNPCIFNIPHGSYTICVTDDNGSGINVCDTITINESPQITATFTIDTVLCNGGNSGAITINASGGTPFSYAPAYHYMWSNGSTSSVTSGLIAGNYSVTVSDSKSCQRTFLITMPQPTSINIGFKTSSDCSTYAAQAIVTGGSASYSYVWSPGGQTTAIATGLSTGIYTVTVTDKNGCKKSASVIISALTVTATQQDVKCYGDCTGSANATASGGNKQYSYSWVKMPGSIPVGGNPIINLCPGSYVVTVIDSNNCSVSKSITINQPAAPLTIANIDYTSMLNCYNDCNGTATVYATGGTPQYSFAWSKVATPGIIIGNQQIISGLCAGTYCVTVTDINSCKVNSCFTISQPEQLLFNYDKTDINCYTDGDVGQITIKNVTGGTPTYQYTLHCPASGYGSSPLFSGLPPGPYMLGVMDLKGCKSTCTTVTIIRPPAITLAPVNIVNPSGFGLTNGSITMVAGGGSPPYTHHWYKFPDPTTLLVQTGVTSTLANLGLGIYCDTITDAHGCKKSNCVTLIEPSALFVQVDSSNISCFGEQDGWIKLTVSGSVSPYTVLYNNITTPLSNSPFTYLLTNLAAGNYTFVIKDANLNQVVRTVTIIEPAPIIINFQAPVVCYGQNNGTVTATPSQGTPPYHYQWSNGGTTNQISGLLASQWYLVTVTDTRSCPVHDSVFLPQNPNLIVHINNLDSTVCKGSSIQMNVDGYGGTYPYTFAWLPVAGVINPNQLEPLITPTFSDTYVITMTDVNHCTATDSITILIDSVPHAAFSYSNVCQSRTVIFTNLSIGYPTSGLDYVWDFGDGNQSTQISPTHTYTGLTGTYNVSLTVTTGAGCVADTMRLVTINPVIQVDFEADTACFGIKTKFTGYSLNLSTTIDHGNWYFDDLGPYTVHPWVPSMEYQFTYAGLHSVRLTLFDNTGCADSITKPVLVKSLPQVDFTYTWGCTSDTVKFTGISSGAGGVKSWKWIFGDPASGSANYAYTQNAAHVYNSPGLYHTTLIVTGNNNCVDSVTKQFYYDKSPNAEFAWSSPCFGTATHFTDQSYASTGNVIVWQWNFGDNPLDPQNVSGLQNPTHTYSAPGTYQVKLKVYDNGYCYDSITHQVVIFSKPLANFNVIENCVGDFTVFHDISTAPGSAISHWHWNFGDSHTMDYGIYTDPVMHLYALQGQYTVVLTVTDTNGCSSTFTRYVNVHALPTAMFQFNSPCANQLTFFTDFSNGSGSQITSWHWNFGDFSTPSTVQNPSHTYINPGLYDVILCVTNANGCVACDTQAVSVYPSPVADFTADTVCKNAQTHFHNLSSCMGDNIVSWQWDFGDFTGPSNVQDPFHTFTSAGTFNVSLTVTTLHGCVATVVKQVVVHEPPVADFSWSQPGGQNCFIPGIPTQFNDMSTITGGNLLNTWVWDFGDGVTGNTQNPVHQYTHSGTFYVTLTVFDINGCQNSTTKPVILGDKPVASFSYSITDCDLVCFTNTSIGSGVPVISWYWDFGDPAAGVSNFSLLQNPCHNYFTPVTKTYTVRLIVTNANGCSDTLDLPVTVSKPVPDFTTLNPPCQGMSTQFHDLSVSTGNFIAAWSWDFGEPPPSAMQDPIHVFNFVGSHYVTLTVTNGNGCSAMTGKNINISYPPAADWDFDHPNCFPDSTHFHDFSVAQGSIPVISYDWDFGDGTMPHATVKDPVHKYAAAGTYAVTLTVVNANGCQDDIAKPFYNYPGPVAAFTTSPVSTCKKEIVTFTDQSTPAFGNITSWDWNFGDSSPHSTIQNISHVYQSSGVFTVTLIVHDERGCAATVTHNITVNDLPATDFTADTTCIGNPTQFVNLTPGTSMSWEWDFGEPVPPALNTSTAWNPQHTYLNTGDYFVRLTATDNNTCHKDTIKKVTVVPLPAVNFSNSSPCSGEPVHFTDQSIIYQGSISGWSWDFDDPGPNNSSTQQNPTHIFSMPKIYNVTLTITSTGNCPVASFTKQVTIRPAPVTAFTNSPPCDGEIISFTDMTDKNGGTNLVSWDWNFGDLSSGLNNNSTLQNPTHTFSGTGDFIVTLIVGNADGCSDTIIKTISVKPKPGVDFTFGSSCASASTCFLVNSTVTNTGMITSYAWDLDGDGTDDSFVQNPCFVYPIPGIVNVKLTVTDTNGCHNSTIHAVNVKALPVADFNTTGPNCEGDSIHFIDYSTSSTGFITRWTWHFGDLTPDVPVNFPTNPDIAHFYSGLGPYNVKLIVLSSSGCENFKTQSLNLVPSPLAVFSHTEPCLSDTIQFTDLSATNGGGTVTSWLWNFGDPASLTNNTSILQNPTHIFAVLGTYPVKLTVNSSNGCHKDTTINVSVMPLPPVNYSWTGSCINQLTQFTVDPGVTNIPAVTNYHWTFGDGGSSFLQNPPHYYAQTGNYNVTLTIKDIGGCSNRITHVVNIGPSPTALFASPGSVCANDSVTFTNLSSTTSGYIQKWEWDFGDFSPHKVIYFPGNPNVKKKYSVIGTYTVTLTVTTSNGCLHSYSHDVTIIPTPVANFQYTDTCENALVHFTDVSFPNGTGSIVSWKWDFGDAGSGVNNQSFLQNPSHDFTNGNSTYQVSLIVENSNNCTDTIVKPVHIRPAPPVDFTFNTACVNQVVTFNANPVVMTFSTIATWDWDFGDGTAHGTSPVVENHAYGSPGNYTAVLTVTDLNGCQNAVSRSVSVMALPIPGFAFEPVNCDSVAVQFTDQSIIPSGYPGYITTWVWHWGDGTSTTVVHPANPNVSHVFPGNIYVFNVKLVVTSDFGCKDSISHLLSLTPAPVASFEVLPGTPSCANQLVQFHDLSQTNGGGIITTWLWNFGDPVSGVNNTSSSSGPSHLFTVAGSYFVTLTVTNSHGCINTITLPVTINTDPVATFSVTTVCEGNATLFANLSIPNATGIVSYSWTFGDGGTSSQQSPWHTYTASGFYNTTLTIVNTNGCMGTITKQVAVNPKPVAGFAFSAASCIGNPVTFTDLSFIPSGFSAYDTLWTWDFGDGTPQQTIHYPNSPDIVHTFAGNATSHFVKLIVATTNGCSDSITKTVNSIPSPIANFNYSSTTCVGQLVSFTDLSQTNGGGNIQTWNWNFGDPLSGTGNTSTVQNPDHSFTSTGVYIVVLNIMSANGCGRSDTVSITIDSLPVANFTYSAACENRATSFTSTSIAHALSISSYSWDFGDGGTSTLQSPQHNYASHGIFNVTLTIVNSNGCIHTVTKPVTVYPKPVPDFTVSQAACVGLPVNYYNQSFVPAGFSSYIDQWIWDFGDGSGLVTIDFPVNPNVTHTFNNTVTTHSVKLKVKTTNGCTDSISKTVTSIPSPVASYTHSNTTCIGQEVDFTDLTQTNGGGSIQTWSWNFGDILSGANNSSTLQNPSHTFTAAGNYTVTLTVTSSNGCVNTYTSPPITINSLPTANFTSTAACEGSPVTFTDASTTPPGGIPPTPTTISSYAWNFGDGGTAAIPSPQHVFASYGYHNVTLMVTNSNGCIHSVTKQVLVNPKPVADFTFSPGGCVGNPVSFYNQSFVPPGFPASIQTWQWDFGDGVTIPAITFPANPNITHTFAGSATSHVVTLTVTTTTASGGCVGVVSKTVTSAPAPVANFTHSSVLCQNQPVQFTDISQTNGGGNIQTWSWNFGDPLSGGSNTSTFQNPTHVFSGTGPFDITMIVVSANGCIDTLLPKPQLTMNVRPLSNFKADTACLGSMTTFTNLSIANSGSIVSYWWDFGDGVTSTISNPGHTYSAANVYNVKLTVTSNLGCLKDTTKQVLVLGKPNALFSNVSPNCAGDSVQFNDYSTTPHGYINKWEWDFGDGSPVVSVTVPGNQNVKHKFTNGGTYSVKLTITTSDKCTDEKISPVTIGVHPIANFSIGSITCPQIPVYFTDLSQLNGGSVIQAWHWNFGDPGSGQNNTSTLSNPDHTYNAAGNYQVHLTITNASGCIDSVIGGKQVVIHEAPVAAFSTTNACVGSPVQYTDNSTPAGSVQSWNWNFGDPSSGPENTSTLQNPTHIYNLQGTYAVTLHVLNASQCYGNTVQQVNINTKPTAGFQYDAACEQDSTQFTDQSLPNGNTIWEWDWNFGDGTPHGNLKNPKHSYAAAGNYNVTLTVTNLFGCKDSITKVVIANWKPVAAFTYVSKFCEAGKVFFFDGSQGIGGASIVTREWIFNAGQVEFGPNPEHDFSPTNMFHPVTLTVTDNHGCKDKIKDSLVFVKPGWGFTFNFNDTCEGFPTKFKPLNLAPGDSLYPVLWNFGDPESFPNNTSMLYAPTHKFSKPGTFPVKMKAQNSDGCVDSIYLNVTVEKTPKPDFNFVSTPCDSTILFEDVTPNPSSGNILSWKWRWGDGDSTQIFTPLSGSTSHLYVNPGVYKVTLIVTNVHGCIDSLSRNVQRFPCIAAGFTNKDTLCARYKIAFSDTSLPVSKIKKWHWIWGDGKDTTYTKYKSPIYHIFADSGTYHVNLTINALVDGSTVVDSLATIVKIHPTPKTYFSNIGTCLHQISLFQDTSKTWGEKNIRWNWSFSTKPGDTSLKKNPGHKYDSAGIYNVKLVVMNKFGCKDSLTKPTHVYGLPVARFENSAPCSGDTTFFTDKTLLADTTIKIWRWFFGDRTTKKDTSGLQNPEYRFPRTDIDTIRLIVIDGFGCSDTTEAKLKVNQSPVAAFTLTENIDGTPGEIRLNNESSKNKDYQWYFGNGKSSTEENPIVKYEEDTTTYIITLVVIDTTTGCSDITYLKYEFLFDNLFVPNAFSPSFITNQLHWQDIRLFKPKGLNLSEYHVMIFDKWGHLVWESTKLDCDVLSKENCVGKPFEGWDGTFNGEPLPQDVYMWKIYARFKNGKIWEGSDNGKGNTTTIGTVTLIR